MGSVGQSSRPSVDGWPLCALFLRSSSTNSDRAAEGLGSFSLDTGDVSVLREDGEDRAPNLSGGFLWTSHSSLSPKWQYFCRRRERVEGDLSPEVVLETSWARLSADTLWVLLAPPASSFILCREERCSRWKPCNSYNLCNWRESHKAQALILFFFGNATLTTFSNEPYDLMCKLTPSK